MFDIISIGSATFDVFIKSSKFPLDKMMVGEKIEAEEMLYSSGGGGSNVAVGLKRLGLNSTCIARFGDDLFGQYVLEELKKENLNTKYLLQRKGDNTDYSSILVNPDGSRIILVNRGKTRIEKEIFPWEALDDTKNIYIASLEGNVDLLTEVVNKSAEKGIGIFLNPGSREIKEKEKIMHLLPKLKLLILNYEEAENLGLGQSPRNLGVEMIIITNGKRGAKLFSAQGSFFVESFSVPVIDETGAGDAFSTGFVGGILKGFSIDKCLKLGMASGASVVSKFGAKPGLLFENEISGWMDKKLTITS